MAYSTVNLTLYVAVIENCRVSVLYLILSIKINVLCRIALQKKDVH